MMRCFKSIVLMCLIIPICLSLPTRAEEGVNVQLVRLKTDDGVNLTGVLRRPRASKETACVVLIHGYSGNFYTGVMEFLPEALTNRGIATLATNM
ncbi:MAG: hypothetical protein P8012_05265, partial [Desulfobacterales bacterium]